MSLDFFRLEKSLPMGGKKILLKNVYLSIFECVENLIPMAEFMNQQRRIYIVEDEKAISEIICLYMEREGYKTIPFYQGDAALYAIEADPPDLIILDIMLPGIDGITLLGKIRETSDVPVIFLTAKKEELDRILGLELGADDYVTKPFLPNELVARVRSLFRRVDEYRQDSEKSHEPTNIIKAKNLTLDLDSRRLLSKRESVGLTPMEFMLLQMLMERPGRIFQRAEMEEMIRGGEAERDTRAMDMHVRNLRKKILEVSGLSDTIKSVRGVGYTFED